MNIAEYITRARYLCKTLSVTNPNAKSFEFALKQTKEALNELRRPQPYVGSTCYGIPPSKIFGLLEKFDQLEKCQVSSEEFCSDFKLVLDELECINSRNFSIDKFNAVLAELLLALSNGRGEVDSILERLSEAFSNLPSKEKERLLLYKK